VSFLTALDRRNDQVSPQETDLMDPVAQLLMRARRVLGTEAEARAFMTTPHPQLDGHGPIDSASTDLGTRYVAQILNALEYGLSLIPDTQIADSSAAFPSSLRGAQRRSNPERPHRRSCGGHGLLRRKGGSQ
jgi:hypothetical protein